MTTLKSSIPANWDLALTTSSKQNFNVWKVFAAFADSQKEKKTMWYFISLLVQGVFFLPLPAFLIYYFNAPIIVLGVSLCCFFTSIIACMGGAGIRGVLLLSMASIVVQIIMTIVVLV